MGMANSESRILVVYIQTERFLVRGFERNLALHHCWFCCLFKDSRHGGNRVRKLRNLSGGSQIQVVWDSGHCGLDPSSSSLSQAPPQRVVFKVDVPLQCNTMVIFVNSVEDEDYLKRGRVILKYEFAS